ncbi:YodC family protein [Burkholderia sp. Ac-20379]|uniref:YodC family protein n=1 Tax=Burkholderia sp. Ac-20379 TaxID=2703900 RepID=UPI00197F291B|nr:YodC family protein [Burkholderia sp. Ac-20379]MBN3725270.1 YodC family protein [Burkholderia sp. Ac-20379]
MTTAHDIRVASPRIGDVVTLKTGGPRMTVTFVGAAWLTCQWFDVGGDFCQERFAFDAVVREPTTISAGRASLRSFGTHAGFAF